MQMAEGKVHRDIPGIPVGRYVPDFGHTYESTMIHTCILDSGVFTVGKIYLEYLGSRI